MPKHKIPKKEGKTTDLHQPKQLKNTAIVYINKQEVDKQQYELFWKSSDHRILSVKICLSLSKNTKQRLLLSLDNSDTFSHYMV